MPHHAIVPARPQDLAQVPLIELAAARLLRGHAPESVLDETTSPEELQQAFCAGHLWVALADDVAIGCARVEPIDEATVHLEELDVLPAHGRRGLGTRLVEHVCGWAAASGYQFVTLTTFRDVPWNMPFYERLGFRAMRKDELPPALHARVRDEARRGLDPSRRVVMIRSCGRDDDPAARS